MESPQGTPSRVFDALAGRVGAIVAGRNAYEDSGRFGGGSPHPAARLMLLSHRPVREITIQPQRAWERTAAQTAAVLRAADAEEQPRAFVGKRTPVWQGQ
ncbi:hypothetical protein HD597_000129 [Nonomuraea thailandensis]|uniref:Uncharacterized protein n=1 Tax=Nonomuraea thailandensis TaxID=1188745 RepID=A0A9X2JYG7_9ACTN|nr:hypothetical protein [Nonomuraea thailandensis]MCP2353109.1 hypothetical protein [Nonomuraea thailandensis]